MQVSPCEEATPTLLGMLSVPDFVLDDALADGALTGRVEVDLGVASASEYLSGAYLVGSAAFDFEDGFWTTMEADISREEEEELDNLAD